MEPRNDKERKGIENEIGIHAISQHETVVKTYESFAFNHRIWTFMEFMEGGELTRSLEGLAGR